MTGKRLILAILLVNAAAYLPLFYMANADKVSREKNDTVSEKQWAEYAEAEGCRPVTEGTSVRTVNQGSVTYRDQGRITTYECKGRVITARQFP